MFTITKLPLRTLLLLDGATCAAMGALLTLAPTFLSEALDIPFAVLFPTGLVLFPIAACILFAARMARWSAPR